MCWFADKSTNPNEQVTKFAVLKSTETEEKTHNTHFFSVSLATATRRQTKQRTHSVASNETNKAIMPCLAFLHISRNSFRLFVCLCLTLALDFGCAFFHSSCFSKLTLEIKNKKAKKPNTITEQHIVLAVTRLLIKIHMNNLEIRCKHFSNLNWICLARERMAFSIETEMLSSKTAHNEINF